MVSLLGTTANIKELEGNGGNEGVSTEVQAVVGIATPALVADGKNSTIKRMIGLSNEEIKQTTTNITEDTASTLIDQFTFNVPELIQLKITRLFS